MTTFEYLSNLPDTVNKWTKKGVEAARNNPEIKNFLNSFSSTPSATPTTEKR